jgi:hypothetical protein
MYVCTQVTPRAQQDQLGSLGGLRCNGSTIKNSACSACYSHATRQRKISHCDRLYPLFSNPSPFSILRPQSDRSPDSIQEISKRVQFLAWHATPTEKELRWYAPPSVHTNAFTTVNQWAVCNNGTYRRSLAEKGHSSSWPRSILHNCTVFSETMHYFVSLWTWSSETLHSKNSHWFILSLSSNWCSYFISSRGIRSCAKRQFMAVTLSSLTRD